MNKQKGGAVYTPEILTNYIAKTTIENFLLDKLNTYFSLKMLKLDNLFSKYIQKNKHKVFVNLSFNKNDKKLFKCVFKVLKCLKVLDPAVGSGHILVAVLKILEKYYLYLKSLGILNWTQYEIREHIITKNLFGIDIESEAIEITKKKLLLKLTELNDNSIDVKIQQDINSNYRVGNAIIGFIKNSEISPPNYRDLDNYFYDGIKGVFQTHKDLKKMKLTINEQKAMLFNLKPFHWFSEFPEILLNGGFDIIIENPPYISNKKLRPLEKAIFQEIYKTSKGLLNTFGIFMERSIKLCHPSSIISYVVHKNIIRSNNYDLLRKFLLEYTSIEEIIDVGARAFESITAETVIIVLKTKQPSKEHEILIKTKYPHQKNFDPEDLRTWSISQNTFLKQENYNINLNLQYKELEIINYIKENKDCDLIEFFEAKTCIATGDDEKFLANRKINDSYKKTLRGKNIGRYSIDFDDLYVYYNPKILHRARDESIFKKPEKLIMQTISSNLNVAYDNKNYYPLSTCIAIVPKENVHKNFNIKSLLLLMNSKLLNFYYDFVFNLGAHLTTEISVNNINRLPLKSLENYGFVNVLVDFMNQINEKKALRKVNKEYIEFLEDIINILIYEIIFSIKFQLDGLNTDISSRISQLVSNIKLISYEKILEFIKSIVEDEDMKIEIKTIRNHPWVSIIEEFSKR